MSESKLIVEFLNKSPDFALGFEAGRLYKTMRDREPKIEGYYLAGNLEHTEYGHCFDSIGSLVTLILKRRAD